MTSFGQRIRAFLGSPKSKKLIEEGKRQLAKPENQRKLRRMLGKLRRRR